MTPAPPCTSGSSPRCVERGDAVGHALREVELRHHPERGLEARPRRGRPPSCGCEAPEHVGRADDVAERGEALGDGADVRRRPRRSPGSAAIAGPVPGLREPDVEVERAVVDGDLVGASGRHGRHHRASTCGDRTRRRAVASTAVRLDGLRLRPAAGGHRPDARSSPATRPGCWSTAGRAGRPTHRHVRDLPELLRPTATCWSSTTPGCIPARLRAAPGDRRRGRGAAARAARRRAPALGGAGPSGSPAARGASRCSAPDGRRRPRRRSPGPRPATRSTVELLRRRPARRRSTAIGEMPLPPYITRAARPTPSATRRCTPREPGSAAAPTAGLHLTAELLDALGRARRRRGHGRAGRRARHVPAGHRRRPDRAPHAQRALPGARRRRWTRAATPPRVVAVGTTSGAGPRVAPRPRASSTGRTAPVHPPAATSGSWSTCC